MDSIAERFLSHNKRKLRELPGGIIIGSLNEAARRYPEIIEKHYGRYASGEPDGLIHLNTALASDGIFVYIPKGVTCRKPVQVVNLVDSSEDVFSQHRNLIIVDDHADFKIIICDHTLSPQKFLTNAVTEVYVGDNARFDIIRCRTNITMPVKLQIPLFIRRKTALLLPIT
jgi:Fe-S cluster assembly protein SufD